MGLRVGAEPTASSDQSPQAQQSLSLGLGHCPSSQASQSWGSLSILHMKARTGSVGAFGAGHRTCPQASGWQAQFSWFGKGAPPRNQFPHSRLN